MIIAFAAATFLRYLRLAIRCLFRRFWIIRRSIYSTTRSARVRAVLFNLSFAKFYASRARENEKSDHARKKLQNSSIAFISGYNFVSLLRSGAENESRARWPIKRKQRSLNCLLEKKMFDLTFLIILASERRNNKMKMPMFSAISISQINIDRVGFSLH